MDHVKFVSHALRCRLLLHAHIILLFMLSNTALHACYALFGTYTLQHLRGINAQEQERYEIQYERFLQTT
jgi:hypothetical protein